MSWANHWSGFFLGLNFRREFPAGKLAGVGKTASLQPAFIPHPRRFGPAETPGSGGAVVQLSEPSPRGFPLAPDPALPAFFNGFIFPSLHPAKTMGQFGPSSENAPP
ncbi:MAG: hypothetical protein AAGN35_27540, partial [Bacteroidota bacterium]